MEKSTKEKILKMLSDAQYLVNDAYSLLDTEYQEKCNSLAGLTCDIDEAIAEVESL